MKISFHPGSLLYGVKGSSLNLLTFTSFSIHGKTAKDMTMISRNMALRPFQEPQKMVAVDRFEVGISVDISITNDAITMPKCVNYFAWRE